MTRDRTYFRMLSDTDLADAARHCDNDLALVLGERLRDLLDVQEHLEGAIDEIRELKHSVKIWMEEAGSLQASLDRIDAE